MSLHSLIATGGKVVVIGGTMNDAWRPYEQDPRVVFWCGDRAEVDRHIGKGPNNLPSNTHGIILSRFLGHATSSKFIAEARRRRLVIMGPKNDGEVTRLLQEITQKSTKPPVKEVKRMAATEPKAELRPFNRGELKPYILNFDDATKPIIKMAEVLVEKMRADGINVPMPTMQHAISEFRRSLGIRARAPKGEHPKKKAKKTAPEPEAPKTEIIHAVATPLTSLTVTAVDEGAETILKMIDDLMAGIGLLRETFVEMRKQTTDYRTLEATLRQLGFTRK